MYTDINQCYHVIQGAVEDKMIDKIINQGESVKLAEGKLDNQGITPARKSKVSFIKNKRIENLMSFYVMQANRDKEWMYYITDIEVITIIGILIKVRYILIVEKEKSLFL